MDTETGMSPRDLEQWADATRDRFADGAVLIAESAGGTTEEHLGELVDLPGRPA